MSKNRHERKLINTRADVVVLAYEVELRYLRLCKEHLKMRGTQLAVPSELHAAFIGWRELRVRHKCVACGGGHLAVLPGTEKIWLDSKSRMPRCAECLSTGDYRHRAAELQALEDVAKWTLRVNADLRGQPVPEWEGVPK